MVCNQTKCGSPKRRIRWAELHSIKKIEEFCPEIEIDSFGQASNFRNGEVPIVDSLSAQRRIYPRLIAQAE